MAINKNKNVMIQVTFPKKDAEQLDVLQKAFANNGVDVTKSQILLRAFRDYLRILVMAGAQPKQEKHEKKVEEPQGDKKDA